MHKGYMVLQCTMSICLALVDDMLFAHNTNLSFSQSNERRAFCTTLYKEKMIFSSLRDKKQLQRSNYDQEGVRCPLHGQMEPHSATINGGIEAYLVLSRLLFCIMKCSSPIYYKFWTSGSLVSNKEWSYASE